MTEVYQMAEHILYIRKLYLKIHMSYVENMFDYIEVL